LTSPTGLGGRDEAAIARDGASVGVFFAWTVSLVIAIIAYAVGYLMFEDVF
jgi:hypothetical protein